MIKFSHARSEPEAQTFRVLDLFSPSLINHLITPVFVYRSRLELSTFEEVMCQLSLPHKGHKEEEAHMMNIHSFIHSGYFYSASSSPLLLRGAHDTARMFTVLEFHAEAPQAIASEGLTQGPYVVVKAGFEPATLRTCGAESTKEPPRPAKSARTTGFFTPAFLDPNRRHCSHVQCYRYDHLVARDLSAASASQMMVVLLRMQCLVPADHAGKVH